MIHKRSQPSFSLEALTSRRTLISIFLVALSMLALGYETGRVSVTPSVSPTITISQWVIQRSCSFIVFTDGNYYYSQSGGTGAIIYGSSSNLGGASGKDAAGVIYDTISALTSGGKVCIRAGTYTLSTRNVNLGGGNYAAVGSTTVGNIELAGEGNSTILMASSNLDADVIGFYNLNGGIGGWYIHDLQIDGNRANQNSGGGSAPYLDGVWAWDGSNTVVEHVYVHDCKTDGIDVYGTNPQILNNWVVNNDANGITLDGPSTGGVVAANAVNGASDVGITLNGNPPALTDANVYGNVIMNVNLGVSPFGVNSGVGIQLGDTGSVSQAIVANNVITNTAGAGIASGPGTVSEINYDITIEGNSIHHSGSYGIYMKQTTSVLTEDNLIGTTTGIWASGDGIYLDTTTSSAVMVGNQIYNPSGSCVYLKDAYFTLQGNYCLENSGNTAIYTTNADHSTISDNTIISNSALMFLSGSYISVSGNTMNETGSGGTGVNVVSNYDALTGNTLYGTGGSSYSAIWISGSRNVVSANTMNNWNGCVIEIGSSGTGNEVIGNSLPSWTCGDNGSGTIIEDNAGYNPQGHMSTPFDNTKDVVADQAMDSGSSTPNNRTTMTVVESPKLIMVVTGTYTAAYTLVIQIDGSQVVSITNPASNLVYSFTLHPGQTFYCQYHTAQTTFVVSGE